MSMSQLQVALLTLLVWLVSALYASVGHGGASGDIAVMGLVGISTSVMKPLALILNLCVAIIATFRFGRSGYFSWRTFWPFALTSIPGAFIGGHIELPSQIYRPLVGCVLLFAAYRLALVSASQMAASTRTVPVAAGLAWGAAIGLLSGLTGVGGGLFLSPLLLLSGWADARESAGVASAFIVVNSIAGLAGDISAVHRLPSLALWLVPAAIFGGLVGSYIGSARISPITLRRVLAATVALAAVKMIATSLMQRG